MNLAKEGLFFDSHAHLSGEQLAEQANLLLERAKENRVGMVLNICTDKTSLEKGLLLSKKHPELLQAAAATPHDVDAFGDSFFQEVEKAAREGLLQAIGESGLDYYYTHSKKETQKTHLRRYIKLAKELSLPLIIHLRDAFDDLIQILDEEQFKTPHQGILHCFTGNEEQAKQLLQRGFTLSFSGIVTFKKSTEIQQALKITPLDRLLIETDAPYLAPHPMRGKTNEPAFLPYIASFCAKIKGCSVEEIQEATWRNGKNLFLTSSP